MTGHARIVHRTTTGLRRPRPVEADIQPFLDQINRAYAATVATAAWRRAPQWPVPVPVNNAPTAPLVCGSSELEDTERTPAGIVDYPGPDALDHYARGGVIRVPGRAPGRSILDDLPSSGYWV